MLTFIVLITPLVVKLPSSYTKDHHLMTSSWSVPSCQHFWSLGRAEKSWRLRILNSIISLRVFGQSAIVTWWLAYQATSLCFAVALNLAVNTYVVLKESSLVHLTDDIQVDYLSLIFLYLKLILVDPGVGHAQRVKTSVLGTIVNQLSQMLQTKKPWSR